MLRKKTKWTALFTLTLFLLSTVFGFGAVAPVQGAQELVTIHVEAIWNGEEKPDIAVQIFGSTDPEGIELEEAWSGVLTEQDYAWDVGLNKYNDEGIEYVYTVQFNAPAGYNLSIDHPSDGFEYYVVSTPVPTVVAEKQWSRNIPGNVTRPDIAFELWELKPGDDTPTYVAAQPVVDDRAVFEVPENPYAIATSDYFVREVFMDPDDPTNDNWAVSEDGLTVFNELKEPTASLYLEKFWTGDEPSDAQFEIALTGPYGYAETFWLTVGEQMYIDGLYFGTYGVQELNAEGYQVTYKPMSVDLTADSPSNEILIFNAPAEEDPPIIDPPIVDPPIVDPPVEPPVEPPALIKDDHFVYMFGYPDVTFRANGPITRAEVTSMFARLMVDRMEEGKTYTSNFSDVPKDAWYVNTVGYMSQKNIIRGYPDGTFRPDAPVTRAEFAAIAARFDKLVSGQSNFPDVANDHWAKKAIDLAYTKGWVKGYPDGTFKPENNQTRAETLAITNKMLERHCDVNYVQNHGNEIATFKDLTNDHWAYYEIMETCNAHDYEWVVKGIEEKWIKLRK